MEKLRELQSKSESKGGSSMKQMIMFNDLVYQQPRQASLISQRHHERYNAQNQSYSNTSSSINFIFQTGDQLVDCRNSYIQFKINVDYKETDTWGFGKGSAVNFFSSASFHSRQGDLVDHINDLNIYRVNKDLEKPLDYFNTVASAQGYGLTGVPKGTDTFLQIPLCSILNVFDSPQLMPAQLASGSRLELVIEKNHKRIFVTGSGDISEVNWQFTDVRLVCMLSRPTDGTSNQLEKNSAANGLEYTWAGVHTQRHNVTSRLDENISKSVARALRLIIAPVIPGDTDNENAITPVGVVYNNLQARAGSSYFPQYRLTQNEIYLNNITNNDSVKRGARYDKKTADAEANVCNISLETHNLIQYSGQALNNSRQLYVESDFTDDEDKTVYLFLEYMRSARVYLNSVAVDS